MRHEKIATPPGLVQRALAGHAAIGLLAGALLYIIALSGTLVVIHDRWQRWEQPGVAEMADIAPAAVQRALAETIRAQGRPTTHAYVHMPSDTLPRTVVTTDHGAVYVDGAGRAVAPEAHAFTEFLIALHTYLHLPMTWGLIAVGALGTMLAALALTGVLAHPRIVRDAFRLRARGQRQLAQTDWHNRLGVWTLPFVLAVTMTGAFIGLGSVGFQLIANERHGGDITRAYAPIFGPEPAEDKAPAPLARADRALAWMAANRPGVRPIYVTLEEPYQRGQQIVVLATHPRRLIYGESYRFDGDGRYLGTVGLSDGALGQQFAASTYNLHFGNFGGWPIELAWLGFGLALCAITATGMSIWLQKRRRRGLASPRLEGFWTATVWGVPALLVACAWVRGAAGPGAPLVAILWSGLALLVLAALVRPALAQPWAWRRTLAAMTAATGAGHLAWFGVQDASTLLLDAALLATGALLWRLSPRPAVPA